jgi:hypothetical protein
MRHVTVDLDRVIQTGAYANLPRRVRCALAESGDESGNVDASLEIAQPCGNLGGDCATVTMGDEDTRSDTLGQRCDGRGIVSETCRWISADAGTRQVDGPPRDTTAIELRPDVAPTPRSTPGTVHEYVRRRSHTDIFLDQRSEDQLLEWIDGAAF